MTAIRQRDDESGFTLIELLVVVIIIGILASIAIPVFLNQREKAQHRAALSDARNAALAIESYLEEELEYPAVVDQALPWVGPGQYQVVTGGGTVLSVASVTEGVSLDYRLDALGSGYCVEADHDQLDGDANGNPVGDVDVVYDSNNGGIQPTGGTCSF